MCSYKSNANNIQFLGQILKWGKSTNLIYINGGWDLWFNLWQDFLKEHFPSLIFEILRTFEMFHNVKTPWNFESTSQTATWDLRDMKLNSLQHSLNIYKEREISQLQLHIILSTCSYCYCQKWGSGILFHVRGSRVMCKCFR